MNYTLTPKQFDRLGRLMRHDWKKSIMGIKSDKAGAFLQRLIREQNKQYWADFATTIREAVMANYAQRHSEDNG